MQPSNPLTSIVRVPRGDDLGDAMSRIRTWLDGEKIQTTTFTTTVDARGFMLTIGFVSIGDARRFRRQFSDAPNNALSGVGEPALARPVL